MNESEKYQLIDTNVSIKRIESIIDRLVKNIDLCNADIEQLSIRFDKYNIENDNNFKCMFCNIWSGKNKASLGAHVRNCKSNPKNNEQSSIDLPELSIPYFSQDILVETPSIPLPTNKEKTSKKSKNKE
jgi:hypothetical protein